MVDHLYPERCVRQSSPPPVELGGGAVGTPAAQQPANWRVGAKQHDEVATGRIGGQQVEVDHRTTAFTCLLSDCMSGGDQPAQRCPAGCVAGEHSHSGQVLVDLPTATHRSLWRWTFPRCADLGKRQVGPEDRGDTGSQARAGESDRSAGAISIGEP
jgi:hypothetical protein